MSKIIYPSVGVVILTYNAEDYILPCLKSVFANTYQNFSVTVVDNHSSDNTVAIIKKRFPKVTIIQNKTNSGYGAGNNLGIRYYLKHKTDYVLLLNPDTIVKPTLIQDCCDVLIHHNTVGVVGPMIMYEHIKDKIWFAGGYYNSIFCYTKHPHMNQHYARSTFTAGQTDFITGACMMIRTSVFKKVALLPELYFLYFEDTAFCLTVRKTAYTCYFLPKPLVFHNVSAASGLPGSNYLTPLKAYYFARNNFLYIRNDVSWWLKIPNSLGQFCIRFPYYALHLLRNKNYAGFTWYIQGMIDGLLGKTGKPSIFNHL